MRILLSSLLALGICGCTKVKEDPQPVAEKNDAQQDTNKPKRRSPGGVAGLVLPGEDEPRPAANGGQKTSPPPQPAPSNDKTIFNVESRLVEWPKYKEENPNVVEVDPKVTGWDPYSTAAAAYVSMPARLGKMTLEYDLRLKKELNGGKPVGFKEFAEAAKKSDVQFKHQPPYRLYGYNSQTGKVVILEDKAMKRKIYKDKGIPLDE